MKRGRRLGTEEIKLWRHVVRDVVPMEGRQLPELPPEEPPSPPIPEPTDTRSRPITEPAPSKKPKLPPLAPIEKKLRQRVARGQREIDMTIDLHGMRQAEAHAALTRFIHRAHEVGARIVLIVTGKGGESEMAMGLESERGVLRRVVPHWLADPAMRRFVIGYESAPRGQGGAGALFVRIRRARGEA